MRNVAFGAIFAVSFSLLIDEIMLSAIFHVLLGAGNTVAAIAIALIGLSSAGIVAYLAPIFRQPDPSGGRYRTLLFWFALSLMASAFLIMAVPVGHGDFIYSSHRVGVEFARLAIYQIAIAPFFLGGLVINTILRAHPPWISRLYFFDLLGAAVGCAASPFLLNGLGAPRAIVYGAVPALLIGGGRLLGRGPRALLLLPLALLALDQLRPDLHSFRTLNTMGEVERPRYRSFPVAAGDIEFEKWALDAWTIIRDARIPQQWENFKGWGLSSEYRGPIPAFKLVNYNARFSTYVTEYDGDLEPLREWLDADLTALHYLLGRRFENVLNIGAGGGREVLNALNHDAKRVVAVDVSHVVVDDIMKGRLREFSGKLYQDPRVTAIADEGRNFAERSSEAFDLIDFSIVGGMNLEKMDLVRADDLFTLEALRTYLGRLAPGGVFSYVMYTTRSDLVNELAHAELLTSVPYIPALRTLSGLRAAFEEEFPGRRFRDHVLIAGLHGLVDPNYDLVHILASASPFSEAERQRFLDLCARLNFVVFYPPQPGGEPNLYTGIVAETDLDAFARTLPFSIWPPTDDKPFQFAIEPERVRTVIEHGVFLRFLGDIPLISLAFSISALALLVTLIPLLVLARNRIAGDLARPVLWGPMLFFALIGYGYMAIEISVLLKLQQYLGNPIYGLSVGLFSFLLASGLGSASTHGVSEGFERVVQRNVALLVVLGVFFLIFAAPLFQSTISASLPARIGLAVATIFPLAFLMGTFFPIGIKLVGAAREDFIPWAWAINGCLSVLGIFGTRIAALFLGFSRALVIGLLAYAAVALCVAIFARRSLRERHRPAF